MQPEKDFLQMPLWAEEHGAAKSFALFCTLYSIPITQQADSNIMIRINLFACVFMLINFPMEINKVISMNIYLSISLKSPP